jgi:hypothetical protein
MTAASQLNARRHEAQGHIASAKEANRFIPRYIGNHGPRSSAVPYLAVLLLGQRRTV